MQTQTIVRDRHALGTTGRLRTSTTVRRDTARSGIYAPVGSSVWGSLEARGRPKPVAMGEGGKAWSLARVCAILRDGEGASPLGDAHALDMVFPHECELVRPCDLG